VNAKIAEAVRAIAKRYGFDEESDAYPNPQTLCFATREYGDVAEGRPGREDKIAARAIRAEINVTFPTLRVDADTCDEWVNVRVTEVAS
jgi:hypothetical protein